MNDLKNSFLKYCADNGLLINSNQLEVLHDLNNFFILNKKYKKLFFKVFKKKQQRKLNFYLDGDVGVGKTLILDFYYNFIDIRKKRTHFNEFMIDFHNFRHTYKENNKDNSLKVFVKKLKNKYDLIYFDEFQVTNIVDAMILGKLFENIYKENIITIITSNIKIENLYIEGLQRELFKPFLKIFKMYSIEKTLNIDDDYRKISNNSLVRFFYPLNEENLFKINKNFRILTKGKKLFPKKISVKGRILEIKNYYEKIARFNFDDLCSLNVGAEDYIKIMQECDFIIIESIPNFNDQNKDKQQRFITLIDIIYEKKIPLMISSEAHPEKLTSSILLSKVFKRTISRIYELTSPNFFNKSI